MKHQTLPMVAVAVVSVVIIPLAIFAISSANVKEGPTLLAAQAFMQTLRSTPEAVLVDVRTPAEYQTGHIAGAMNIPVEDASFGSNIAQLDHSKTYFLYCHSGRRSALATAAMHTAGFTHLHELQGGVISAPQLLTQR